MDMRWEEVKKEFYVEFWSSLWKMGREKRLGRGATEQADKARSVKG